MRHVSGLVRCVQQERHCNRTRKQEMHLILATIRVHCFCVRFVLDTVQVLMQPIQKEGHKFLGIMLSIACKLTGLTCHYCLQEETVGNICSNWWHELFKAEEAVQNIDDVLKCISKNVNVLEPLIWRAEKHGECLSIKLAAAPQTQLPTFHLFPRGYYSWSLSQMPGLRRKVNIDKTSKINYLAQQNFQSIFGIFSQRFLQ